MTAKTPREIVLEDALREIQSMWRLQLHAIESVEYKTTSVSEMSDEMERKLRRNIEWVEEVLE